jgi:hypothetical protein
MFKKFTAQDVSKVLRLNIRSDFPTPNKGKVHTNVRPEKVIEVYPPHSPDHNPLGFYLWGHLRTLLYSTTVAHEETIHKRIFNSCHTIRNDPRTFKMVRDCNKTHPRED